MKNLIFLQWKRPLKMFITGVVISTTIFNNFSSEVSATSQNQTIKQTIQTLQKSEKRWVLINLKKQNLIAWEGNKAVYAIAISSGKKSTPTLTGTFKIQTKLKTTRMRGRGYDVPNVPHTMFYDGGYAIHGAYWHKRFGTPVSHGCVNLAPNHAKWMFKWAEVGTPIVIQK